MKNATDFINIFQKLSLVQVCGLSTSVELNHNVQEPTKTSAVRLDSRVNGLNILQYTARNISGLIDNDVENEVDKSVIESISSLRDMEKRFFQWKPKKY